MPCTSIRVGARRWRGRTRARGCWRTATKPRAGRDSERRCDAADDAREVVGAERPGDQRDDHKPPRADTDRYAGDACDAEATTWHGQKLNPRRRRDLVFARSRTVRTTQAQAVQRRRLARAPATSLIACTAHALAGGRHERDRNQARRLVEGPPRRDGAARRTARGWAAYGGEDVTVVFEQPPRPPIPRRVIDVKHAPRPRRDSADDEIVRLLKQSPSPDWCAS